MSLNLDIRKGISIGILFAFLINTLGPIPEARGDEFRLPAPGVMVHLSSPLEPPMLKGIKVHPDNPFRFDFILDQGDSSKGDIKPPIKQEATKLIKYFLASLTIPENDLWVNLSPYEKDRIIPQSFGLTEMGRDLLAEDYMLKQITASLIYPEDEIGKKFWKRIYEESEKKFGTTNIPVNTFNKVWIVPEKAVVYENPKAGTAYVVEAKLKVMLEQDYLSMSKHEAVRNDVASVGANIVREIVIPELTKEVNEDKNFSQLRQVYNSLILATWYKKKIKDSILEQVYADKNKIQGLVIPAKGRINRHSQLLAGIQNKSDVELIYQRYLQAFKRGAFNYIKEDQDPQTRQSIPRKYFSGGENFAQMSTSLEFEETTITKAPVDNAQTAGYQVVSVRVDAAMLSFPKKKSRIIKYTRNLGIYLVFQTLMAYMLLEHPNYIGLRGDSEKSARLDSLYKQKGATSYLFADSTDPIPVYGKLNVPENSIPPDLLRGFDRIYALSDSEYDKVDPNEGDEGDLGPGVVANGEYLDRVKSFGRYAMLRSSDANIFGDEVHEAFHSYWKYHLEFPAHLKLTYLYFTHKSEFLTVSYYAGVSTPEEAFCEIGRLWATDPYRVTQLYKNPLFRPYIEQAIKGFSRTNQDPTKGIKVRFYLKGDASSDEYDFPNSDSDTIVQKLGELVNGGLTNSLNFDLNGKHGDRVQILFPGGKNNLGMYDLVGAYLAEIKPEMRDHYLSYDDFNRAWEVIQEHNPGIDDSLKFNDVKPGGIPNNEIDLNGVSQITADHAMRGSEDQGLIQILLKSRFLKRINFPPGWLQDLVIPDGRSRAFIRWLADEIYDQNKLDELAQEFIYPPSLQGKLKLKIGLFSNYQVPQQPNFYLVGAFTDQEGQVVGFFSLKFYMDGQNHLMSHLLSFFIDQNQPYLKNTKMSDAYRNFVENNIYKSVPVAKETIRANYIGRHVWAFHGYEFNFDREGWIDSETGRRFNILSIARRNLLRFLQSHDIAIKDLLIGDKPVKSVNDLKEPIDFAKLRHKDGLKIIASALIADNTLGGLETMDVGKAFLLADYRYDGKGPYIISETTGHEFSAQAMPYWDGIRLVNEKNEYVTADTKKKSYKKFNLEEAVILMLQAFRQFGDLLSPRDLSDALGQDQGLYSYHYQEILARLENHAQGDEEWQRNLRKAIEEKRRAMQEREDELKTRKKLEKFDLQLTIEFIENEFRRDPTLRQLPIPRIMSAALGPSRVTFLNHKDEIILELQNRLHRGNYDQGSNDLRNRITQGLKNQAMISQKFTSPSEALKYLLTNGDDIRGASFFARMKVLDQQGRLPDSIVDFLFNAMSLDHIMQRAPLEGPQGLAYLRQVIPEPPSENLNEGMVLRYLLANGHKPSELKWIDYVKLLDIAYDSYAPIAAQGLYYAANALDRLAAQVPSGRINNLEDLRRVIPVAPKEELVLREGKFNDSLVLRYLLTNDKKPKKVGWNDYVKLLAAAYGPYEPMMGKGLNYEASALDHLAAQVPSGEIKNIDELRLVIPPPPQGELNETLVLRHLLGKDKKPEEVKWNDYVQLLGAAYEIYMPVTGQALERVASALDHLEEKLSSSKIKSIEDLRRVIPAIPKEELEGQKGKVKDDIILRYLLIKGKLVNVTWSDYVKLLDLAYESDSFLPKRTLYFAASALDHLVEKMSEGSVQNVEDLRRFIPEPPQGELNVAIVLRHLLKNANKPAEITWLNYVKLLSIAYKSYAPVANRALEQAASALDNFGKEAPLISADNYIRNNQEQLDHLIKAYFASLGEGQQPTKESITLFFLEIAIEGQLPKGKNGKTGLASSSFMTYYPRLAEKVFAPALALNGGVDLTPVNIHLQIQNKGSEIKFHINPAMLAQLQNAPGFVPVILSVKPLKSLSDFLEINH